MTVCPFCGYRFSVAEMIAESFLYLILVAVVLLLGALLYMILLDFRL